MGWLGSGLAGLIGGYEEGRQAKYDRQQQRQALALQQQQQAADNAYRQQSLTADQQYRQQQQAREGRLDTIAARGQGLTLSGDPLPPLPFTGTAASAPKNGGDFFKSQLLRADQLDAQAEQLQAAGRTDEAKLKREHAQDLRSQAQTFASGSVGLLGTLPVDRARVGLIQAQAQFTRQWRDRQKMALAARMQQIAAQQGGANGRAAMEINARVAAARLSAQNAMARTQYSADMRDAIVTATMLNAANGQDQTAALRNATVQYQAAMRQRENDFKAYAAGKTTSPGFDPSSAPPSVEQFYQQPAPAQPMTINVNVPQANGAVKPIPVTLPQRTINPPTAPAAPQAPAQKLHSLVAAWRKAGQSDAAIRAAAIASGQFTPAQVDAALGKPAQPSAKPDPFGRIMRPTTGTHPAPYGDVDPQTGLPY